MDGLLIFIIYEDAIKSAQFTIIPGSLSSKMLKILAFPVHLTLCGLRRVTTRGELLESHEIIFIQPGPAGKPGKYANYSYLRFHDLYCLNLVCIMRSMNLKSTHEPLCRGHFNLWLRASSIIHAKFKLRLADAAAAAATERLQGWIS